MSFALKLGIIAVIFAAFTLASFAVQRYQANVFKRLREQAKEAKGK